MFRVTMKSAFTLDAHTLCNASSKSFMGSAAALSYTRVAGTDIFSPSKTADRKTPNKDKDTGTAPTGIAMHEKREITDAKMPINTILFDFIVISPSYS